MAKGNAYGRVGSPDRWKQDKIAVKFILSRTKSKDAQMIDFFNSVPKSMVTDLMREFLYLGFSKAVNKNAKKGSTALMRAIEIIKEEIEDEHLDEMSENPTQQTAETQIMISQNEGVSQPTYNSSGAMNETAKTQETPTQMNTGIAFLDRGKTANFENSGGQKTEQEGEQKGEQEQSEGSSKKSKIKF